jgi:SUKH superfamily protein
VGEPIPRYHDIAELFRAHARSEGADVVPRPTTHTELTAAEEALGCQFPDSYRWFQLEFGNVAHGPVDIYSVLTPEPSGVNIVGINLDARHDAYPRLPAHLIAFSDSGGGDLLCFDTSIRRDGECPVVWWDHEETRRSIRRVPLPPSWTGSNGNCTKEPRNQKDRTCRCSRTYICSGYATG